MFFFLYFCQAKIGQDFNSNDRKDGPPHPTVPPSAPHCPIVVECNANGNFDIYGIYEGNVHRTSFSGYSTRIRVDGGELSPTVVGCEPLDYEDVSLFTSYVHLSNNSVLFTFRLHNTGTVQRRVDLEVDADVYLDARDDAAIVALGGGHGFMVYSSRLVLTVINRGSPLVNNVTTYWYGYWADLPSNYWTQTLEAVTWDIDSAMAWSWQGIEIPPGGTVTKSNAIEFGIPFENHLEFAISSEFPSAVIITDVITLTGAVAGGNTQLGVRIMLVVDSNPATLHQIGQRLPAHGTFEFTFSAAEILSSPGEHLFSFYAIDDIGCVSNPHSFHTRVIFPSHTRSRTRAATYSRPRSATVAATHTRAPPPSVPPGLPHRLIWDCATNRGENFDLRAFAVDNEEIRTTFNGYITHVREGGNEVGITACATVTVDGVDVRTHLVNLCPNTILIVFVFQNQNAVARNLDLEVHADVWFDGQDHASITQLDTHDRRGYIVYSDRNLMTYVLRGYPMVTNVSTYWFGEHSQMDAGRWQDVQATSLYEVDSALAWSWQRISIPARNHVSKSIIVKMGPPLLKPIQLLIHSETIPAELHYRETVLLRGHITSEDPGPCSLLLMSEQDPATVHDIAQDLDGNGDFEVYIAPGLLGVVGRHTFSIYAIDEFGALSNPFVFNMTVIAPSKSPSRSPPRSRTRSPSPSLPRTATPRPAPTYPPNRVIPLFVECSYIYNFDFVGLDGFTWVGTTLQGWLTRLRVRDSQSVSAVDCQPLHYYGVTLSTNITKIGSNAAVVVFNLVNGNSTSVNVSVEGEADIFFDGNDFAPVRQIPNQRGFIIYGSLHMFTFVGRGHPFVTDVSTYWFGEHHSRADYFWTQIIDDAFFEGDSGFAFTWQNVTIPGHGKVSKSLWVKFGFPDVNRITVHSDFSGIPNPMHYLETKTITVTVVSVDTYEVVNLFLVVDHNPNAIYQVVHEVEVTEPIQFSFHPANYALDPGAHTFSVYAIDSAGTISDGISFETRILAPSKSASHAPPTQSRTPLPSRTRTRTPLPHPSVPQAPPHIPMTWTCSGGASFDLMGQWGDFVIRTSFNGYSVRFRHANILSPDLVRCQPMSWLGYEIHSNLTLLAPNTVHLSVRVINRNATASSIDIVVISDILFDQMDDAPVERLPGERGFVVYSDRLALSFLTHGSSLVNDVTTFWFGYHPLAMDNYWTQVVDDFWAGDDTGVAFSWQQVLVPAHGNATKSMIIMFGLPDRNQITLSLDRTGIPSSVHATDVVHVSASITSFLEEEYISIVMTVDHDAFLMFEVTSNLHVSQVWSWSFTPAAFDINPGTRDITFYAIDTGGTISNAQSFSLTVIAPTRTPSRSPAATATISRSRSPSLTATRPPAPTLPPGPAVPITTICGRNHNFDLAGNVAGRELVTSFQGWATELRMFHDGPALAVSHCAPLAYEGFTLYTNLTKLSSNAALVNFKFVNTLATVHSVLLDVYVDANFDGDDAAPIHKTDDGRGFVLYDHQYAMTVLVRGSPLIDNVTTFWFGPHALMTASVYSQVNETAFWGGDSGFAFSWQNVVIPSHGVVGRSFIVKFCRPALNVLQLSVVTSQIPSQIHSAESHPIVGHVVSVLDTTCRIFVVVDGDTSMVYDVKDNVAGNSEFTYQFVPRQFDIHPGGHNFTVVAVDSVGTVSNGATFHTTVIAPTKTPSRSPPRSGTATPHPTHTQTARPPPAPTLPPAPVLPINVVCSDVRNFDLHGLDGDVYIPVTFAETGFATRLRVGQVLSDSALHCHEVSLWGVHLYTNVTKISSNAAIVNFIVSNHNATNLNVSWEVDADIQFDHDDYAPVMNYDNNRRTQNGFIVYSDRHALTFIGRRSPLVDDVSTYWFGEHSRWLEHYWAQVHADYFVASDSAVVFTWQNITLRPNQNVSKSVIMKFGLPDLNELIFEFDAWIPNELYVLETVDIWGFVLSIIPFQRVNVLLAVDDVTSMLYLMVLGAPVNEEFDFTFSPSRFRVSAGLHKFSLWAVDLLGTVSSVASFTTTIVTEPPGTHPTPTQSHRPVESPHQSATHPRSATHLRTRTRSNGPRTRSGSYPVSHTPTRRESPTASLRRSTPPPTRHSIPPPSKSHEPSDPTYPKIISSGAAGKGGGTKQLTAGGISGIVIAVVVLVGAAIVIIICWRRTKHPDALAEPLAATSVETVEGNQSAEAGYT